jgi:hypothetical protein
MNVDMEEFHANVRAEAERLERKYVDDAIIGGASDAASILDKEVVRDQIGKSALMREMRQRRARQHEVPKAHGPRRFDKKRPTRRQRVKAARKRNR